MLGAPGRAPHPGSPSTSDLLLLSLSTRVAQALPWFGVRDTQTDPCRLQPRCDPAALSLPPRPEHLRLAALEAEDLRYLHRGRSIAGTCTGSGASPVPTPRLEHLRYLHRDRSISGTCTGTGTGRRAGRGAERPRGTAGPVQGKVERPLPPPHPESGPGETPMKKRGKGLYFSPTGGSGERRPRSSEPVLKVKSFRVPELVHRPGNNEVPLVHLPLPSPGLGFWKREGGKPNQIFPSANIWGPSPRRGPGAAGKAEKTRVEIIRSDLFPWSDSSFEQLPNGSFCLSESFSSRFCSD